MGGATIEVGDVIVSGHYIGRFTQVGGGQPPIKNWEVVEIKERFTPKGDYLIDPTNIGFIAIVEPHN